MGAVAGGGGGGQGGCTSSLQREIKKLFSGDKFSFRNKMGRESYKNRPEKFFQKT